MSSYQRKPGGKLISVGIFAFVAGIAAPYPIAILIGIVFIVIGIVSLNANW
jgi:hypothetical protein